MVMMKEINLPASVTYHREDNSVLVMYCGVQLKYEFEEDFHLAEFMLHEENVRKLIEIAQKEIEEELALLN